MRFASTLIAAALAGCSSDPPVSACRDEPSSPGFDPTTPRVLFANDVMPIFGQSCAFSTCHGSTTGPANGVFLGRDPARVHAAIVNVRGDQLSSMPFVTPGRPTESYLMRKMDGTQCALDAQCTGSSCQSSMPKGTSILDPSSRDVVRRWIAQGAKND